MLASDKDTLFGEQCAKNFTLNDKDCQFPNFTKRTDISFSEVLATPILVAQTIFQLEMGNASGKDEIPVVVLKTLSSRVQFYTITLI